MTLKGGCRLDMAMATTERAGRAQHAAANTTGEPNTILVVLLGANDNEANLFRAHAALLGLCDKLVNAPKLAYYHKVGGSPKQSIVTGLHERSRRGIMDGLRSFIAWTTAVWWTWVACAVVPNRFM